MNFLSLSLLLISSSFSAIQLIYLIVLVRNRSIVFKMIFLAKSSHLATYLDLS